MIGPPPTATRGLVGQQRFQTSPFLVGQIMSMQHPPGLPHPALKIRGTRSNRPHRRGDWVAFAPDGHTLATASDDQTVLLWDVTDPARPRRSATR